MLKLSDSSIGYEKCYRAAYPWLGMSVSYQVSLDAARVYESIRNGSAYLEDIAADTNIPIAELSVFLQELMKANAIYEDNNDSPNGFGTTKGMDLAIGNLYENERNVQRRPRDRRVMPTNLMNIMKDENLAAIVIPDYAVPVSPSQPSQEEMAAFMQQLMMAQQAQQTQQIQTQNKGGR